VTRTDVRVICNDLKGPSPNVYIADLQLIRPGMPPNTHNLTCKDINSNHRVGYLSKHEPLLQVADGVQEEPDPCNVLLNLFPVILSGLRGELHGPVLTTKGL